MSRHVFDTNHFADLVAFLIMIPSTSYAEPSSTNAFALLRIVVGAAGDVPEKLFEVLLDGRALWHLQVSQVAVVGVED
jgi:hypothetical protein